MSDIRTLLRHYQLEAVDAALAGLATPTRDLIVIPTGGGKTWVIAALAELAHAHQILIATPRRRLLQQTRGKLHRLEHGVMAAGQGEDTGAEHRVIVGTVQTLIRREIVAPDLIIIDECHLIPNEEDSRYGELLRRFPHAKVIGLTATPIHGTDPLAELGWTSIFEIGLTDLILAGFLVPPRSVAVEGDRIEAVADLDTVTQAIVPRLVESVQREGSRRPLVFASDIAHATRVAELLREAGEESVFLVHSQQTGSVQNDQFKQFETANGRAWLVNVAIVSIGIDLPAVDAVAILRDVSRFALLMQIIGRGLRTAPGKTECLVFDFGNGTERFGFLDQPKLGESSRNGGTGGDGTKACPECRTLAASRARECKHCGHQFSFVAHITPDAHAVNLLSDRIRVLTISTATLAQQGAGWLVEYRFAEAPELRAFEASKAKPTPRVGRVLVENVAVGIVEIKVAV